MAKILQHLVNRGYLWVQKRNEVARFEGIVLADVRRKSPHFKNILLEALQLIRDYDPRRFARVQRHIGWIVNCRLELNKNAEYNCETRTCNIDFTEPKDEEDRVWSAMHYSRTLIHEATHAALISQGIAYTAELRARIEKLCITEEKRFLRRISRLRPDLSDLLVSMEREFESGAWEKSWTASRWQRAWSALQHLWQ
jgi:hypothetical protein